MSLLLWTPEKTPQDSSSNWLKMQMMNMFLINNLNKHLMKKSSMIPPHKRPSQPSNPWWRSMTPRDKVQWQWARAWVEQMALQSAR